MTNQQKTVLIVEDDSDWRLLYQEEIARSGWRSISFDNVPQALHAIRSGDVMYDAAIVDKGGSNSRRGMADIIAHRDGLEVLRELKKQQPFCVRILSTGELWSKDIFEDKTICLHMFMDKGYFSENRRAMFAKLKSWNVAPNLEQPILYTSPRRRERMM